MRAVKIKTNLGTYTLSPEMWNKIKTDETFLNYYNPAVEDKSYETKSSIVAFDEFNIQAVLEIIMKCCVK